MKPIFFKSRKEARFVLKELKHFLKTYGFVTLADYYDLAGVSSTYTDNKFGWDRLIFAHTKYVGRGKYIIVFPVKPFIGG